MQGASLYFKLTFLVRSIRKATYFNHNIYIKSKLCLSKNTYVFVRSSSTSPSPAGLLFLLFSLLFLVLPRLSLVFGTFLTFLFFYLSSHGQMNTRGLISYLWRPLIGLGKKLVPLPLSGSCNRLLKISFSIGFRNMKSTHVYSFGHDLINVKIKM